MLEVQRSLLAFASFARSSCTQRPHFNLGALESFCKTSTRMEKILSLCWWQSPGLGKTHSSPLLRVWRERGRTLRWTVKKDWESLCLSPHILFIFQVPCIYSFLPCSFDPTALHHRIRCAFRHLRQRAPSTRNPRVPVLDPPTFKLALLKAFPVSSPPPSPPGDFQICHAVQPSLSTIPPAFCLSLGLS